MKTAKLENLYNRKHRSWNRASFNDNEYGFEGIYTHKDLGLCEVFLNQDAQCNYYLMLEIWHKGYEYTKSLECSSKPSKRLACLKAKEFLIEVMK